MEKNVSAEELKPDSTHLLTTDELLDQVDTYLTRLERGYPTEPVKILTLLDEVQAKLDEAEKQGISKIAEKSHFDYIIARVKKDALKLFRLLGGHSALQILRDEHKPAQSAWWWFLDQWLAEQAKKNLKKNLTIFLGIVGVLIILGLVYQFFLAPDPATQAAYNAQTDAQREIGEGKLDVALQSVDKGLQAKPGSPELLLLKAVILEKLGQNAQAQDLFTQVEQLLGNREQFLQARSLLNLQIGDAQAAKNDSTELIQINPQSAEGYYYLGQSNQALGDLQSALANFQKASDLAQSQNKPELVAMVRVNMAYLIQSMGGQSIELTPTVE